MTADRKITSLGYCDPPLSDFDDVLKVLEIVDHSVKVKVGGSEKAKQIRPTTTVILAEGQNHAIPGRINNPIKLSQLSSFLPIKLKHEVETALDTDKQTRKNNLRSTKVVK